MDRLHGCPCALCLVPVAERDEVESTQRSNEPSPEIAVVPRVIRHTRRHEWMCDLQQYRCAAPEERGDRRAPEPAHDALRREVAVAGSDPFRVSPHCRLHTHRWISPTDGLNRW